MNAVVLLGPPGAGKGTVAELLADHGYQHVSTGDLLRKEIQRNTPLGIEAATLIDQGKFVSDSVATGMIKSLLESSGPTGKFVLDGFPRTLPQAGSLDEFVEAYGVEIHAVIVFECPDKVIVERLSGRRTCRKCGAVYHVTYNPPSRENVCDLDGCELLQRPDDNEETIRNRLKVYTEWTAPLIAYYKERNLICTLDATQSIEEVRKRVLNQLT